MLHLARAHLLHLFTYLLHQPGYHKRLQAAAGLFTAVNRMLAGGPSLWPGDP